MPFYYPRQIRFHETDGAGVVYFANVLTLCHEAYEASLAESGLELAEFFSPRGIVVPVIHGSVDFVQPMHCGDRITIVLTPKAQPSPKPNRPLSQFQISYRLLACDMAAEITAADMTPAQTLAQATTRHVCIDAQTRQRQQLSASLQTWLRQWQQE